MVNKPYLFSWLLFAIYYSTDIFNKSSLRRIIATGDRLNHAIFSFEEMNLGLSHLSEICLIEFHDTNKIKITKKASRIISLILRESKFPIEQIQILANKFNAGEIVIDFCDNPRLEGFGYNDYNVAVNYYVRKSERRMDKKNKRS